MRLDDLDVSVKSNKKITISEEQQKAYMENPNRGILSDKLEFVCCLMDPAKKLVRTEGGKAMPTCAIVGYKFKLLQDMQIPFEPYKKNAKYFYDTMPVIWKDYKAGDIVQVTVMGMGRLLSQPEFDGEVSGGDIKYYLSSYRSKNQPMARPTLKKVDKTGSIKNSAEFVASALTQSASRSRYVVKPEFEEQFGGLYRPLKKDSELDGAKHSSQTALAFAAYYNQFDE